MAMGVNVSNRATVLDKETDIASTLLARDYKGFGNQSMTGVCVPCITPDRVNKKQNSRRFKEDGDPMFTLTGQDRHGILQIGELDIKGNEQIRRVYSDEGLSPTLNTMQGGNRQPKVIVKEATKKGYAEATVSDSINIQFPNSETRRRRVGVGVAQTLETSCNQATLTTDYRIRKLTPREVWRLMGFSDEDFKKAQDAGISNSQLYKQAGNSIVTNVLLQIFKNLLQEKPKEV